MRDLLERIVEDRVAMLDVYSSGSTHIRRPSCPPDMAPTLSTRSTFVPMEDQVSYQRQGSLVAESITNSGCHSPSGLMGRPKSKSLTTLQMVGRSSFSAIPSPELRRKHWLGKILRLRWDVDKIRLHFKKAGSNIRGGMQAMRRKLSPAGQHPKILAERSIVVDFVKDKHHRRNLLMSQIDDFEDLDHRETNFSSSMVLTSLNNGRFTGLISLDYLPLGDIRILISNYKLEIILVRKTVCPDQRNKICRPRKIGDIDIPIYVNPASLTFSLDEDNDSLLIEGITKGYFEKCLSMSTNDVRMPKDYFSSPVPKKSNKKKSSQETVWYRSSHEGAAPDDLEPVIPRDSKSTPSHEKIQAYRTRSNTR